MSKKFQYAIEGLYALMSKDANVRLQCFLGLITIIAGVLLRVSDLEWLILVLFIGLVISLEIINSCIEKVCDMVHADFHPDIKFIKDGSAAAVLVISIFALIAAIIIFSPKFLNYVEHL